MQLLTERPTAETTKTEATTPDFTLPVSLEGENQPVELLMKWLQTGGFYWMVWDRVYRERFADCVGDEMFVRIHRRVNRIRKSGEHAGFEPPTDPGEIKEAFRRLGVVMKYWGKRFASQEAAERSDS